MRPPTFSQGSTHVLRYNDDTERYELWGRKPDGTPYLITERRAPSMIPGVAYYSSVQGDDILINGEVLK